MQKVIVVLAVIVLFAGCSTPTQFHKTVTVEKDGDGKIIKTTVVEEIVQPELQQGVQSPKHLDQ